ncbi:MAG TPA: tetratricopeptide repeat protein [Bryobacteraceae bacterium]|nr:tetratricopeptide repeat protein [Bryobacteraceae bacterium]
MIAFVGILFAAAVVPSPEYRAAQELSEHARQLYDQAQYTQAEPLYRQAVEAWGRLGPDAAQNRAIDLRNLGALLRAIGRYHDAEPLLNEAVRELEVTGSDSMELERALFNLAALYRSEGELPRAESFAIRAVDLAGKRADVPAPDRQAPRLVLASIYLDQRRYQEAESVLNEALEGADGAIAAAAYNSLSSIAINRDDFPKAEEYARQALYFARLALPPGHPAVAAAWNNLAQASRFEGKYLEAERDYRQAISVWEDKLGPAHPFVAQGLMNLAAFYHERGREAGAESLYARAAEILEEAFGKTDPRTLSARNELAEVLRAERRFTESEKLGRSTLEGLEKVLQAGDPALLRAQTNYARLQATKYK